MESVPVSVYIYDWMSIDIHDSLLNNDNLQIRGFGKTEDHKSVCICINNFCPYFYIKVPDNFSDISIRKFYMDYKKYIHMSECQTVYKKDFFGFNGEKTEKFLKIVVRSEKSFKYFKNKLSRPIYVNGKLYNFECYETNLDPLLRFLHDTDSKSVGWHNITCTDTQSVKVSKCSIEYSINPTAIHFDEEKKTPPPLTEVSYDIEVYSKDPNTFPVPEIPENVITHIGMVVKTQSERIQTKKWLFSLFCNPTKMEGVSHNLYETEADLLTGFFDTIKKISPDIMYQFNGDSFDGKYIYKRAKYCNVKSISKLSKVKDLLPTLKTSKFQSSAYGTSFFDRLLIPGVIHFDVMTYFQRNFKEDSYSLDNISKKYLNNEKNKMTVEEMFSSYSKRDKESALRVAEYCLKDCELPQMLIDHFNILQSTISMANVCIVPINYLLTKGQQIKAFSQIVYFCKDYNYIVPNKKADDSGSFTGATVLDPIPGFYKKDIVVLDFASLYPSIIRANNLCYTSIVLDEKYMNLPGYTYNTYKDVTFVQNNTSILPKILEKMALSRKLEKQKMAKTTGLQKTIHNMNQNAYKISMNSIYGFLAAYTLQCKPIASTVTYVGRQMIEKTAEYIESNYSGSKIIYGDTDSVFIDYNLDLPFIELCKVADKTAEECSNLFPDPVKLEFEKIYSPFLIFSKKRYIGTLLQPYTDPIKSYRDSKGVVTTRRDNCKLIRDVYKETLDIIMSTENSESDPKLLAVEHIRNCIRKLKNGEYPIECLQITKSLGEDYKNKNLPHVVVADKMKSRGEDVRPNDRIPYVFVKYETTRRTTPQYKRVENTTYAVENNLEIDYEYYVQNQFKNPLVQIIETLFNLKPRYTRIRAGEEMTEQLRESVSHAAFVNHIFE
jgi:DNA polymerase delta subunit 1